MGKTWDLVVIGSGPAGQRAAVQASKLGKSVLMVEKDRVGGGCLHSGTIPSKALREAALDPKTGRTLKALFSRKNAVVRNETKVMKDQLARNSVDFLAGEARFLDPHTLEIHSGGGKSTRAQGRFILIATGTRPIRDPQFPFHHPRAFDSDSVLRMKKLPGRLLVVGAGVIGCEYTSIFSRLGVQVTLVDRRKELLRVVDGEVVERLMDHFRRTGVRLHLGATLESWNAASGSAKLSVRINERRQSFDAAFICMGREGNTDALRLENAGISPLPRGLLEADPATFRTKVPHIYAAGDVIGSPALAATGAEQGVIAACHAFGKAHAPFPKTFPCGIYTIPELASVGLREDQCEDIPHLVGRAHFRELARGQINGDDAGLLKLLVHRNTGEILGVHVIGSAASELVHIGHLTMALGGGVEFLAGTVFNYPTFAEAYKVAALQALNQMRAV
ncbi:MAG: Si-specific NAD(P)(+) transhydrogenase [Bdellovibrionales bacterium]|nr:Si-specific NAD(P)(+) transhydrogenase [Bdellovibrionales bacterium]